MDGKYAEPLPCWDKDGIFDVSGGEFQSGKERLAALCAMADARSGLRAGGPTLEELARVVDEARELVWTLLTATRGALSLLLLGRACVSRAPRATAPFGTG